MKRTLVVLRALPLACGVLLAVQSSEAFAASWSTGVEAGLPANAGSNPGVAPRSVSCASAGSCRAAGGYHRSWNLVQGLLLTETAGTWATGAAAGLPAGAGSDPSASLGSVSCASAGNCSAVGFYTDSSAHYQGLLLTETA